MAFIIWLLVRIATRTQMFVSGLLYTRLNLRGGRAVQNAVRKAHVRIPERESLLPDNWQPDFMSPGQKAKDNRAIARIQGYDHGELFGQVVAVSGVTLNGQPVKLLVVTKRGQPRDLLDHPEMFVDRFAAPFHEPPVNLDGLIRKYLAKRSVEVV